MDRITQRRLKRARQSKFGDRSVRREPSQIVDGKVVLGKIIPRKQNIVDSTIEGLVRAATYVPRKAFSTLTGNKKMQPPTPSRVKPKTKEKPKTTTPTKPTSKPTETKTKTGDGRAQQMNANAAGSRQSTTKSLDEKVKEWKARKPHSMKPETWKDFPNVGAALNAWRREDPRLN